MEITILPVPYWGRGGGLWQYMEGNLQFIYDIDNKAAFSLGKDNFQK